VLKSHIISTSCSSCWHSLDACIVELFVKRNKALDSVAGKGLSAKLAAWFNSPANDKLVLPSYLNYFQSPSV
jgi:hypothetical protein